jgi:hypothetical protein
MTRLDRVAVIDSKSVFNDLDRRRIVADQLQVLLSRQEFLSLVNRAGFDLSEADLAELVRRNLLRPISQPALKEPARKEQEEGVGTFHLLHLFVLARYFEAVRPTRHPWGAVAPDPTLQDVTRESRQCHDFVVALIDQEAPLDTGLASQWAASARAFADEINPFGPLTDVVGLLGQHGRGELRGAGLLYVRLFELAEQLDAIAVSESSDKGKSVEDQPEPEQQEPEQQEPDPQDVEIELTEQIPSDEYDEHGEPAFEADDDEDDGTNPFSHQKSEVTARTENLENRLDQLRSHDKAVARKRKKTPDKPADTVPTDTVPEPGQPAQAPAQPPAREAPDNLHQRIEELNRLRETYLAEQRWDDLAELYEDGIKLFVEPVERQQVFLTLAMLYEVKLKRLESAFDKFVAAYRESGTSTATNKAMECLQRLGRQPSIQGNYAEFLEAELSSDRLDDACRAKFTAKLERIQALPEPATASD